MNTFRFLTIRFTRQSVLAILLVSVALTFGNLYAGGGGGGWQDWSETDDQGNTIYLKEDNGEIKLSVVSESGVSTGSKTINQVQAEAIKSAIETAIQGVVPPQDVLEKHCDGEPWKETTNISGECWEVKVTQHYELVCIDGNWYLFMSVDVKVTFGDGPPDDPGADLSWTLWLTPVTVECECE